MNLLADLSPTAWPAGFVRPREWPWRRSALTRVVAVLAFSPRRPHSDGSRRQLRINCSRCTMFPQGVSSTRQFVSSCASDGTMAATTNTMDNIMSAQTGVAWRIWSAPSRIPLSQLALSGIHGERQDCIKLEMARHYLAEPTCVALPKYLQLQL